MTNWTNEPLTLDKLRAMQEMVKDIPPPPFFGSSVSLPADHAVKFRHDGRDYLGAHPDFWAKVPKGTFPEPHLLGAIPIYNLDVASDKKAEFAQAMCAAMKKPKRRPVIRTDILA